VRVDPAHARYFVAYALSLEHVPDVQVIQQDLMRVPLAVLSQPV
jgi:hypothetical protein